jgi:NAD(P)-dependent dehydrogenase (short-subunit alcohol dehydrogenase family)
MSSKMHPDGSTSAPLVLVTGVSGFLGAHCAQQLLAAGYRVTTTRLPNWLLRILALFDSSLAAILVHIGLRPRFDISPAEKVLGMRTWRGVRESCLDQAYSLIALGIVPDRSAGNALTRTESTGSSVARERSKVTKVDVEGIAL